MEKKVILGTYWKILLRRYSIHDDQPIRNLYFEYIFLYVLIYFD